MKTDNLLYKNIYRKHTRFDSHLTFNVPQFNTKNHFTGIIFGKHNPYVLFDSVSPSVL